MKSVYDLQKPNLQKAQLTSNVEIPTFSGDLLRNKSKVVLNSGGEKGNNSIHLLKTSPPFQKHMYFVIEKSSCAYRKCRKH